VAEERPEVATLEPKPVRVPCPLGGHAPCVDDLCHGTDTTMCGLEIDFDVCPHGWLPSTCPEGCGDDDPEDWDGQ